MFASNPNSLKARFNFVLTMQRAREQEIDPLVAIEQALLPATEGSSHGKSVGAKADKEKQAFKAKTALEKHRDRLESLKPILKRPSSASTDNYRNTSNKMTPEVNETEPLAHSPLITTKLMKPEGVSEETSFQLQSHSDGINERDRDWEHRHRKKVSVTLSYNQAEMEQVITKRPQKPKSKRLTSPSPIPAQPSTAITEPHATPVQRPADHSSELKGSSRTKLPSPIRPVLNYRQHTQLKPMDVVLCIEHCHNCEAHVSLPHHKSKQYIANAIETLVSLTSHLLARLDTLPMVQRYGIALIHAGKPISALILQEQIEFHSLDRKTKRDLMMLPGRGHRVNTMTLFDTNALQSNSKPQWFPNSFQFNKREESKRKLINKLKNEQYRCLVHTIGRPTSAPYRDHAGTCSGSRILGTAGSNLDVSETFPANTSHKDHQPFVGSSLLDEYGVMSHSRMAERELERQHLQAMDDARLSRVGAFEVQVYFCNCNGRIEMESLHSKLQTKSWPIKHEISTKFSTFITNKVANDISSGSEDKATAAIEGSPIDISAVSGFFNALAQCKGEVEKVIKPGSIRWFS